MTHEEEENLSVAMYMLKNGDVIITQRLSGVSNGRLTFITPAVLITKRGEHGPLGFMLHPWVPNELLHNTLVEIEERYIQASMSPSPELETFYRNWVLEEQDKLESFKELFQSQIKALGKEYVERAKKRLAQQKKNPKTLEQAMSQEMLDLFDDADYEWGDPSTTH